MLKFPSVKRQEITLEFKIKVFVGFKIWYFNLFLISKKLGCYKKNHTGEALGRCTIVAEYAAERAL
jgi:hypothetical protein